MRIFSLLILLAAYGVCYVSARNLVAYDARAVNIVLRELPTNYDCQCKPTTQCYPTIFIARRTCSVPGDRCCLIEQPIDEHVRMEESGLGRRSDASPPPIGIYLDRTPPNHSCHCKPFRDCASRMFIRNVVCEDDRQNCCLHVGQHLPSIEYPEVFCRIFGIGDYAHIHSSE